VSPGQEGELHHTGFVGVQEPHEHDIWFVAALRALLRQITAPLFLMAAPEVWLKSSDGFNCFWVWRLLVANVYLAGRQCPNNGFRYIWAVASGFSGISPYTKPARPKINTKPIST
jgi:hypothetical protein